MLFLDTPDAYYDERRGPRRRDRRGLRRPAAAEDPRRPRRGRLPAADLHEDGAGPADALLRGDRAPRRDDGFGEGNFKALFEAIEREQALRGNLWVAGGWQRPGRDVTSRVDADLPSTRRRAGATAESRRLIVDRPALPRPAPDCAVKPPLTLLDRNSASAAASQQHHQQHDQPERQQADHDPHPVGDVVAAFRPRGRCPG